MKVLEIAGGAVSSDQLLLSKKVHLRPGSRQKSSLKRIGVGSGGRWGVGFKTRSSNGFGRQ